MTGRQDKNPVAAAIAKEVRKDQGETPTFPFGEGECEKAVDDSTAETLRPKETPARQAPSKDEGRASMKAVVNDALGLPPGDGAPHGKGRRETDPDTPRGTLTSADREPNRPAAREHEQ